MYVPSNSNPPSLKLLDAMIRTFHDRPERVQRLMATRAVVAERIQQSAQRQAEVQGKEYSVYPQHMR